MVFTLFSFLVLLSLVVITHELGHFLAAKLAGVKVEEFGLGYPPRAMKLFRLGDTEYTLNWLPFGAFVKVMGEDLPEADGGGDPKSFQNQTNLKKALILVAGVGLNFLLGILLIGVVVRGQGEPHLRQVAQILEIRQGSPAEAAGLQADDLIVSYGLRSNGIKLIVLPYMKVEDSISFVEFIKTHAGKEIALQVESIMDDGTSVGRNVVVVPRVDPPAGEGALGIVFGVVPDVYYTPVSFWQVPKIAVRESFNLVKLLLQGIRRMVRELIINRIVPTDIAGPVGIARLTGQVARQGVYQFLSFGALLSINLAVINILPLPALDGGRLVFVAAEAVLRRRLNPNLQRGIHTAGIALLIFLMLLITFYDIVREF